MTTGRINQVSIGICSRAPESDTSRKCFRWTSSLIRIGRLFQDRDLDRAKFLFHTATRRRRFATRCGRCHQSKLLKPSTSVKLRLLLSKTRLMRNSNTPGVRIQTLEHLRTSCEATKHPRECHSYSYHSGRWTNTLTACWDPNSHWIVIVNAV